MYQATPDCSVGTTAVFGAAAPAGCCCHGAIRAQWQVSNVEDPTASVNVL